jgi:hypothetical protein
MGRLDEGRLPKQVILDQLGYSGDVRFPPNSDQTADVADGPVGAIKTGCGRD